MIARLHGKIILKSPTSLIVETNGVGFEVMISGKTYENIPGIDQQVSLSIYTHLREDDIRLVGFIDDKEKDFFIKLLDVSGISVKIALSAFTIYDVEEIKRIISAKEIDLIRRIPGIGKKLAERLILELKDKIDKIPEDRMKTPEDEGKIKEVREALKTLGYNSYEIDKALSKLKLYDIENKRTEEILKAALKEV